MHLLWTLTASAQDHAFDCATVTVPADAVKYRDANPSSALDLAWDELVLWFDDACVTTCASPPSSSIACEEADCTTAAGAVITYNRTEYLDYWDSIYYSYTEVTMSVTPPEDAGLTWTTADFRHFSASDVVTGTASWTGTLLPEWPEDSWFEATDSSSSSDDWYGSYADIDEFDSEECSWRSTETGDSMRVADRHASVTITDQPTVQITQTVSGYWAGYVCHGTYAWATMDGVEVGEVDPDTWVSLDDTDGDLYSDANDCAPEDPDINPCATDIACDGIDQDCQDGDDTDCDADGDGYAMSKDCDDADASVHPKATELCLDGVDQNCDGEDDCDEDGDGWLSAEDCDDGDAGTYPGAFEVGCDGVDQSCDGADPCDEDMDGWYADADCDDANDDVHPTAIEVPCDLTDQDCDGVDACDRDGDGVWSAYDCDDHCASCFPGAIEVRCDAVDQDCDGVDLCDETEGADDTSDAPDATGCATGGPSTVGTASLLAALILRRRPLATRRR